MKTYGFNIDIYKYSITLIQIDKEDTPEQVRKTLINQKVPKEDANEYAQNFEDNSINCGVTLHNKYQRRCICVFFPCDSELNKQNLYSHEKRHIEDDICKWLYIDDTEAAAYLAGFLGEYFYKFQNFVTLKSAKP